VSAIPQIRIRPEGGPFILGFAVVAILLAFVAQGLGWIGLILTAWCVYFFRDPDRVTPMDPRLVISPADGVVQAIVEAPPPAELGMPDTPLKRVSVFMNVFDCHVNRSPVDGTVIMFAYRAGQFLNASLDKASEKNERRALRLRMADGRELAVVQIAGLVARRILCWAFEGQSLQAGERFGMIRFGSRVDVYLPAGSRVLVAPGQRSIAGETALAELGSTAPDLTAEVR
jgi:phosphatidylserine decarboxylase